MVILILRGLSNPCDFSNFCEELLRPDAMRVWKDKLLEPISKALRKFTRSPL